MVRVAGELGFTPSAWASLGMIDESGRGGATALRDLRSRFPAFRFLFMSWSPLFIP
jgi:hypothetical protein